MDSNLIINYINSIKGSKGLIFAGVNTGNELPFLKMLTQKLYGFEPISHPSVWNQLQRHADSKCELFNVALSDKDETTFIYPASNNFESTSLLKPAKHLSEFPVTFSNPISVTCKRLDSYLFYKDCDVLMMDVQGAEMKVLNGISNFSNIKLIYTEYTSNAELYEGQCSFKDLNAKLESEGFHFCETTGVYTNPNTKTVHGNAIWRKL